MEGKMLSSLLRQIVTEHGLINNSLSDNVLKDTYIKCLKEADVLLPDLEEMVLTYLVPEFLIDAKDQEGIWYSAAILDCKKEEKVYIHYLGWSSIWDEWISMTTNKSRLAPVGTKTWRTIQKGDQIDIIRDIPLDVIKKCNWLSSFPGNCLTVYQTPVDTKLYIQQNNHTMILELHTIRIGVSESNFHNNVYWTGNVRCCFITPD